MVYVDNARIPFRRMLMCHLLADSEFELHAMAAAIGVARRWFQGDHYDVCLTKRAKAIELGAKAITDRREIVAVRRAFLAAAGADTLTGGRR